MVWTMISLLHLQHTLVKIEIASYLLHSTQDQIQNTFLFHPSGHLQNKSKNCISTFVFEYICHRCHDKTSAHLAITFQQLIGTNHLHLQQSSSVIFFGICKDKKIGRICSICHRILIQHMRNRVMQRDGILMDPVILFVFDFETFQFPQLSCHKIIKVSVDTLL